MSDRHDYLALDWVKGEIQETLNQAQQALEAYVENPEDSSRMRFCQTYLHQVFGTLQMVEFYGAALLAEEMEKLVQALLNDQVAAAQMNDALETLMRAILQLPPYLTRIQSSRRDLPLVLLPLLNDLRAARGESLLSETSLFKPDIDAGVGQTGAAAAAVNDPRFGDLVRKIRQMYQIALLGVLRNEQMPQQLDYMHKVFGKLTQLGGKAPQVPLWQVADALVEGIGNQTVEVGTSVKMVLGQIDRELRALVTEGGARFNMPAPRELLKNLLYYVARSNADSPRISAVRESFRLADALPSEELVNAERERMSGPDQEAMGSVVTALSEELNKVKDALERYVVEEQTDPASLQPETQTLKQVADTVAVLGMGQSRKLVEEQLVVLNAMVTGQRPVNRDELMDVAGALLYVEATLAGASGRQMGRSGEINQVPDHVSKAQEAVIRECRAGLEEAKDGIVEFIASQWDQAHLQKVPARLDAVRGGLQLIQLQRPALILRQCIQYISERLLGAEAVQPDWRSMDTLADAITSVEYFLERLSDDPDTSDDILDLARDSVAALGYPLEDNEFGRGDLDEEDIVLDEAPETHEDDFDVIDIELEPAPEQTPVEVSLSPEPAPEPAPEQDNDDLIDDEIIEIFVEEAGEVLEALNTYFPRWAANQQDQEALVEFRRAFHTLKGSGRMVGASTVGELAWSIENMLNRVIDQTIEPSPVLIELVRRVHGLIPDLVNAFAAQQPDPWDVTPLREAAETLAAGGQIEGVPDVTGAATPATASEPEFEIALELEPEPEPEPGETTPDWLLEQDSDELEEISFDALPASELDVPDMRQDDTPPVETLDVDPVLLEIFRNESEANLALVRSWLGSLDQDISEHPVDDSVHRALHTLKGSARMAEIEAVAQVAEPAEKFIKEMINNGIPADREVVTLLEDVVAVIAGGVRDAHPHMDPLPGTEALQARIVIAHDQLSHSGEKGDQHILSVFLSEGMDLIVDADRLLEDWMAGDRDPVALMPLRDELSLLGASADTAGLVEISALANVLADGYTAIIEARMPCDDYFAELAQRAHEALMTMMDFLAAGQTVRPEPELVQALRDLVEHAGGDDTPPPSGSGPASDSSVESVAHETLFDDMPSSGDDADPELVALFLEEAGEILEAAGESLDAWEQGGDISAVAVLQRELHTLKGGALMAGITPVGNLAHELENLYEAATQEKLEASPALFVLLHRCHDRLADMVDALNAGRPCAPATELIQAILAFPEGTPAQAVEAPPMEAPAAPMAPEPVLEIETAPAVETPSDVDSELVDIFLEEADEILESISIRLEAWMAAPDNLIEVQSLQRDLHTLKGGARMAEISALGDLGHELENLYEGLAQSRLQAEPILFDLLQRCHDRLAEMVEAVKEHKVPAPANELLSAISEYMASPGSFTLEQLGGSADDAPSWTPPPAPEPVSPDLIAADADVEILQIFIEESAELSELIEEHIGAWRETPDVSTHSDEIKRALHTLKGGARLAGLRSLGDVSHDFEQFLLDTPRGQKPDQAYFNTLTGWQERINALMADIRAAVPRPPVRPAQPEPAEAAQADTAMAPQAPDAGVIREERQRRQQQPQEMVRVASELLESLVNLAGETSINRGRVEQGISEFNAHVEEMGNTVERLYEQLRRLDAETEAQIMSNYKQGVEAGQYSEDFDPLEMDQYSELHQITKQLSESASDLLDLKSTLLDRTKDTETLLLQQARINTELQEKLMRTRMVPFARLVPRLRRVVRQVSGEIGKRVEFDVVNPEGELDRTLLERVVAPLEHMLRNAVDHGIESPDARVASGKQDTGRVTLDLGREGGEVVIVLTDDGKGIDTDAVRRKAVERGLIDDDAVLTDQEVQQFIFNAGFSTATEVTQISGRGVGMDVVASEIKQMGGSVTIDSRRGEGTRFTIRLPFTLAMNRALMVRVGDDSYAIPLNQIEGIVRISPYELEAYFGTEETPFTYAGQQYDFEYLGSFVHGSLKPQHLESQVLPMPVLLVRSSEHTVAVLVDALVGSREVVVKSVGPQLATVAGISGATILGDGSVVIILDIHSLIRAAHMQRQHLAAEERRAAQQIEHERQKAVEAERAAANPVIMVTDDSVTVRKVTTRLLERNGYEVITAKDGMDAIATLEDNKPDLMLLDIEMPRMDGFEVATHVRHDARLKDVPIIMITSRTGEKHRDRAFDIGVNAYMGKPFQENELLSAIAELLAQARETASASSD